MRRNARIQRSPFVDNLAEKALGDQRRAIRLKEPCFLIELLYALRYHRAREQVTDEKEAQAKDALPEAEKLKSARQ